MASVSSETLLKTYKSLAQVPLLAKARFIGDQIIDAVWSERNLERGKVVKFQKTYVCSDKSFTSLPPIDIGSQVLQATSPCNRLHALIREVENNDDIVQYLEVWNENCMIRSIDLNALELHAKVYTDDEFGSFMWSPDSNKLLYVAEKKEPKVDPLHKRPKAKKEGEIEKQDLLEIKNFKQDWGEQLVGKIQSILVIYDVENDSFTIPDALPEDIVVAKPLWTFDGKGIIGIRYYIEPRKLGLIHSNNRPSSLFSLSLDGKYEELTKLENVAIKCPVLSPNGKYLIFLQREVGGPHNNCVQMFKALLPLTNESEIKLVVDYVDTCKKINNDINFYGLFNVNIPTRCWTKDSRLVFSAHNKNTLSTYVLNIENGNLTKLEYDNGSQIVLDVWEDRILIKRANYFEQDLLLQGKLPSAGDEAAIVWQQVSTTNKITALRNMMFKYMDLSHNNKEEVDHFSAIYIGPENADPASVPLILAPHGGPHSASVNGFSLEAAFHLTFGYAMLFVQYRGSVGVGKKSVEFLLGKVGTADVADCHLSIQHALKTFSWLNPKRVCLIGGSHGGFLVSHLSAQFPDMFRAVIARNPVIDILPMSCSSDLLDWAYVETGYSYSLNGQVQMDALIAMHQNSPIILANQVKAPTLVLLGSKDVRVPYFAGINYHFILKANNIPTRMKVYEDNHSLSKVPNEIDVVLSTAKWLQQYNN